MKIVLAPDSFKGSLTAKEATDLMKSAIHDVNRGIQIVKKPMADGGEGTIHALLEAMDGDTIPVTCTGPLGKRIETEYGIIDSKTAVIECANIAGLLQVPREQRNPDMTTSYGIGEVIIDALDKGYESFIVGLGGSATNDGGLGMLLALGMKAFDQDGLEVGKFGKDLDHIHSVSFSDLDPRLAHVDIKIASDVNNPLYGSLGASRVFGPQKGATAEQVTCYDKHLKKFGTLVERILKKPLADIPGAGAAGGLGFAFLAIGATLESGAALLADAMDMDEAIASADLVITGEGQSDEQTLYGKAPGHIASIAASYNVPVILISGSIEGDIDLLSRHFAGYFSIVNKPLPLEACMKEADRLLYEKTNMVIHMIDSLMKLNE